MNFSKHQQQQQSVYANSQFTNERSNEKHSHMHAVRGSSVEQAAIYSLFANTTVECEFHSCAFNRIQNRKCLQKCCPVFRAFFRVFCWLLSPPFFFSCRHSLIDVHVHTPTLHYFTLTIEINAVAVVDETTTVITRPAASPVPL